MTTYKTRIPPLNLDALTDEQASVLGDRNDPRCELNLFKTLVQHPSLLKIYTPFAMQLGRQSILPPREREIAVLHTLGRCKEVYETAHHLHIGQKIGLSVAEIESAKQDGAILSAQEQTLIKAVDELMEKYCLSDHTWAALAERYSTEQLIEFVFVVGSYTMGAMVNNTLGIQPETAVEETWKPTDKD